MTYVTCNHSLKMCHRKRTWERYAHTTKLCLLFVLIIVSGCATHADKATALRSSFYSGNISAALAQTDPAKNKKDHDADVVSLDRAILQLTAGKPAEAEQTLRVVRDRFDKLEQRSYADKAKALLTDDRQLNYAGEEYERILIRVMLALSNLMHSGGDVPAYALQITSKQQEFLQASKQVKENPNQQPIDYTPLTKQLAIGSYLRAAVLESSPLDYDDVSRCRVQVANWQPDFRDAKIDLARAETGRHSSPGHGVVYVISLVGEGPYKEEAIEAPTTVALLIADRILSAIGKYELPPNVAPVRVPRVVRPHQTLDSIEVSDGQGPLGSTATIMHVSNLAIEQNRLEKDQIIARAVARRIAKKGAVYAMKDGLNVERSPELDLLLTIAGVAWEATERADTRCWSLLPDRIQVLRLELPAGPQVLKLTPKKLSGINGVPVAVDVNVENGRTSFVLGSFPTDRAVGEVQEKTYH